MRPLNERKLGVDQVISRLRGKPSAISGATLILQPVLDLRIGGRRSNAQYQYTLWGDSLAELTSWSTAMLVKMRAISGLANVNTDQKNGGLQSDRTIDRPTAERLGISAQAIDQTLYDAFGQRQIATMYLPLNQYHVVMEPRLWQDPSGRTTCACAPAMAPWYRSASSPATAPIPPHFKSTTAANSPR